MDGQGRTLNGGRPRTAVQPFQFYTSLVLQESTGLRASTLSTLAKLLRNVPESSVYHHTHRFLLQHHYLAPEPTNDFAYWVTEVLGEAPLGERLAGIDTMDHVSLHSLREALAGAIERYLAHTPTARLKFVSEGQEFFFLKSVHVIMPIPHAASTLAEFCEALRHVSIRSLYFHMFDARLRLGRPTNDFAMWVTEQLGLETLGAQMSRLDPYAYSLETLRAMLLSMLNEHLDHPHAEPRSV